MPRASSPLPLLVTLTTLALAAALAPIGRAQDEAPRARCSRALDRSVLDRSLGLGTGYLLRAQRAEGNFTYAYDWHSGREVGDDSQVRQAGASWGLGLIFASERQPQVGTALTRSLGFFRRHSRGGGNARWIAYPGATQGSLGTVALVALAHVERLRALGASTPAARELLDGYLGTVLAARLAKAGSEENFELKQALQVRIGNAAGVDVIVRGAPLDITGNKDSNIVNLTLK